MRVAVFDAFNGASGDMIVASLLGITLKEEDLRKTIDDLALEIEIEVREVSKRSLRAKKVFVKEKKKERSFLEVIDLVESSKLEEKVKEDVKKIFEILARAEGVVHGRDYKNAVFHEVGGDDAIFDIVCSAIGIRRLIEKGYRIFSKPIRVGSGFVSFSHGTYPVPTPVVLEILKNSKLEIILEGNGELLTPTGAAILTHYCEGVFRFPILVEEISYGAGTRESEVPNVLRLILGRSELYDSIAVLETVIDDLSCEEIGFSLERIREKSLDLIAIPAMGKKSRPAILLKVITRMEDSEEVAMSLMRETGTLGVRIIPVYHRMIADREIEEREVEIMGKKFKVRFKRSRTLGTLKPEFDDVAKIAKELEMPIFKVYRILGCLDVYSER
ncbi:MAG: nickel pincer cofactor biosynthesis protein LarC [Archaeoglobaceae archaeon]